MIKPHVNDCPQCPENSNEKIIDTDLMVLLNETKIDPCFPLKRFMTTFDAGGLGNKMSEYATLLAASTLTGYRPILSYVIF